MTISIQRRAVALLAIAVALAGVMAACGPTNDDGSGSWRKMTHSTH